MSSFEKLVPALEDCKKIPQGAFPDTALVHNNEYGVVSRCRNCRHEECNGCLPTPMLEEIEEKTPGGIIVDFDEKCVESCKYDCNGESMHEVWDDKGNAATAALRLWLRINK